MSTITNGWPVEELKARTAHDRCSVPNREGRKGSGSQQVGRGPLPNDVRKLDARPQLG